MQNTSIDDPFSVLGLQEELVDMEICLLMVMEQIQRP
jgi:hypothetical protein